MNRISIYILLIITYLGISKSFSPQERSLLYFQNKYALASYFQARPTTIILKELSVSGLFIKTYLQKYLIISGFEEPHYITVVTPKQFWEESQKFLGMSIFRRGESEDEGPSLIPMPPGYLFTGNPSYGQWVRQRTGYKKWSYYRSFKHYPRLFGYGNFKISHQFIKAARRAHGLGSPFFGLKNEFGKDGTLTKSLSEKSQSKNFEFFKHFNFIRDKFKSHIGRKK